MVVIGLHKIIQYQIFGRKKNFIFEKIAVVLIGCELPVLFPYFFERILECVVVVFKFCF